MRAIETTTKTVSHIYGMTEASDRPTISDSPQKKPASNRQGKLLVASRKTNSANKSFAASSEAANEKSKLTQAVGNATGKLFCGYHQGYADALSGRYLMRNRIKRWMCGACMKRRGIDTPSS